MGELLKFSNKSVCTVEKGKSAKSHYPTKLKATDEVAENKEDTKGSTTAGPEAGTSIPSL